MAQRECPRHRRARRRRRPAVRLGSVCSWQSSIRSGISKSRPAVDRLQTACTCDLRRVLALCHDRKSVAIRKTRREPVGHRRAAWTPRHPYSDAALLDTRASYGNDRSVSLPCRGGQIRPLTPRDHSLSLRSMPTPVGSGVHDMGQRFGAAAAQCKRAGPWQVHPYHQHSASLLKGLWLALVHDGCTLPRHRRRACRCHRRIDGPGAGGALLCRRQGAMACDLGWAAAVWRPVGFRAHRLLRTAEKTIDEPARVGRPRAREKALRYARVSTVRTA